MLSLYFSTDFQNQIMLFAKDREHSFKPLRATNYAVLFQNLRSLMKHKNAL